MHKSVSGFKNIRNIFSVTPLCVPRNEKFPIVQLALEPLLSETNRKIQNARHTLIAYQVLIDIVQFFYVRDNADAGNSATRTSIVSSLKARAGSPKR